MIEEEAVKEVVQAIYQLPIAYAKRLFEFRHTKSPQVLGTIAHLIGVPPADLLMTFEAIKSPDHRHLFGGMRSGVYREVFKDTT